MLRLVSHPLVQLKLTILRDRETPTKIFKELVDEIAMFMAYEATADLALEDAPVDTPLEAFARSNAARTIALGTPKPPRGPEVVAAKTVVTT